MKISITSVVAYALLLVILTLTGFLIFDYLSFARASQILAFVMGALTIAGLLAAKDANAPDAKTVTETRQVGDVIETTTTSEVETTPQAPEPPAKTPKPRKPRTPKPKP